MASSQNKNRRMECELLRIKRHWIRRGQHHLEPLANSKPCYHRNSSELGYMLCAYWMALGLNVSSGLSKYTCFLCISSFNDLYAAEVLLGKRSTSLICERCQGLRKAGFEVLSHGITHAGWVWSCTGWKNWAVLLQVLSYSWENLVGWSQADLNCNLHSVLRMMRDML